MVAQRLAQRTGHYMPPSLLDSQFRTLERPDAQETDVFTLEIDRPVRELVDAAIEALPSFATALPK